MSDIPREVLEVLARVREGGETNMLARTAVINLASQYVEDDEPAEFHAAVIWLADNKDRYMEALRAMGEMVSRRNKS